MLQIANSINDDALQDEEKTSLGGSGAIFRLEQSFTRLLNHRCALAVCNATQGLLACFLVLDIRNSQIITTPYTWAGSLTGMMLLGNQPIFTDIDPLTLTLDPEQVKKKITKNTKAILGVDIYGNPCAGVELKKIAEEHEIWFIQDCAQSLGAVYNGKQSGHYADVAVFSFSPGKPLAAGEGGMITTQNEQIYERLVWWTQHPQRQKRDVPAFPLNEWAINMRIHPGAAEKASNNFYKTLKKLKSIQKKMTEIERIICNVLYYPVNNNEIYLPSYFRYTIPINSKRNEKKLRNLIKENNIHAHIEKAPISNVLYKNIVFRNIWNYTSETCHIAEEQARRRVWLKFSYLINDN